MWCEPLLDKRVGFVLMVMGLVFLVLLRPSPVYASSLVQQNNDGQKPSSASAALPVSFPSNVARGDVVVVALTGLHGAKPQSVSDSLGSSYKFAETGSVLDVAMAIYYATLSASGPDKVTGTFSNALGEPVDVYIFEVSGVTAIVGEARETGGNINGPTTVVNTAPISFGNGAVLIALTSWYCPSPTVCSSTPGAGFTLVAEKSGLGFSQAEYSTSGVAPPTTFPATITATGSVSAASYDEMGIVLEPAGYTPPATTMTTLRTAISSTSPQVSATTPVVVTETEGPLSGPYVLGGIIAIVAIIAIVIGVIMLRRRGWWAKPTASPPVPASQPGTVQPSPVKDDVKFCINCGQQMPVASQFCTSCGVEQPQPSLEKAVSPAVKHADMKLCVNCGQQLPLAARFCKKCGVEQPQPSLQTKDNVSPEVKVERRPVGVTIIAILDIIGGVFLILGALIILLLEGVAASIMGPMVLFIRPLLAAISASLVIFAAVDFVLGWGLWKGKNWARLVNIILLALGIISPILTFLILPVALRMSSEAAWYMLQGSISSFIVGIVINVLFIYILMRRDAKAFFKKGK